MYSFGPILYAIDVPFYRINRQISNSKKAKQAKACDAKLKGLRNIQRFCQPAAEGTVIRKYSGLPA